MDAIATVEPHAASGAGSGLLEPYATFSPDQARKVVQAYSTGKSLRRIAKMPGMPCRMTIRAWERERPDFCTALAYARANKAEFHAERGPERLARVDPDSPFGSARVSLAKEQAAYDRWLAGCLDPATYAPAAASVQVAVVTKIDLGAILPARPTQPDREVT